MFPDRAALEEYWEKTLQELSIPLLDGRRDLCCRAIPIMIWGDEATLNRTSWMLASWNFGFSCIFSCIVNAQAN